MAIEQTTRPLQLTSPLGENTFVVQSFAGEERLSGLFRYTLELVSEDANLDFSSIVGQAVTLKIGLPSGGQQFVNGVVGRFVAVAHTARYTTYEAELHPWLWLLGMCAGCQIFQNLSAPDIVKKVFGDLGFTAYKDALTATYAARDYCVQYNETALAFVSRLLEEEGIFYFFAHDDSSHTLVLADDSSAYGTCPNLPTATLRPEAGSLQLEDAVLDCRLEQQVVVGRYQLDDYNFQIPATDLLAAAGKGDAGKTWYSYPGRYAAQADGESRAGLRLGAHEAAASRIQGSSTCRAFHAGCQFALAGHYRSDANTQYVLTELSLGGDQNRYHNQFEAIAVTQPFRPPLATPRPVVAGCQTAAVVGRSGDEIFTDEYGRVKVKFHWDQSSATDETSSCWIRVAQSWAGKQWGASFLPRVGQEVVVSFEEGDPDRPLITGSVYNAQQVTPYTLPDNQTRSTVKSHSSPQQDGNNEIRFEDKAGSEELFMQAQKDMNVTVLNDQAITVAQNRTVTVQQKNETLVVDKGDRLIQVNTGKETHSVKGTRELTVTGNETRTNSADFTQTVSGNYSLKISGNLSIEVSGSVSIKAGTSLTNKAGTALTNDAGTALTNKAGTALENDAGTSLTNKAGTSMSNQANASIESKANAQQTIESSGVVTVKGALVQIN
ncbi:MAG: type VI secretion system Vgr family protein [Terriglobales bacterium]